MARKSATAYPEAKLTVQIGAAGCLTLPSEVLRRMALEEGDSAVLSLEPDDSLKLVSLRAQVSKGFGLFGDVAPGVSLADELIRERREEARRADPQGESCC